MKIEKLDPNKRLTDTNLLAPFFERKLLKALAEAHQQGLLLHPFETMRSPARQNYLYEQGRTRTGAKVTRARAWESWHQYGLACDVAFFVDKKWSWEGDWDLVHEIFHRHGFETLSFEKAHVQITGGIGISDALTIVKMQGLLALWDVVEKIL